MLRSKDWWREAVVYQIYPRSYADASNDGIGDIPGIRTKVPYLKELGIDAVWLSPHYPSPMLDAGYDVSNYRDVEPLFGKLSDIEGLIADLHSAGIKMLIDIVPNHTSWDHPWFKEALAAAPADDPTVPAKARYAEGPWAKYHLLRGQDGGKSEPNNWESCFTGPSWTQLKDADGKPTGWWYLHIFDKSQPDLDWTNEEVRADFRQTLRFWFDKGINGFRIDVAHGLAKTPGYPDCPELKDGDPTSKNPYWDQDALHDVWREWRKVADEYDDPKVFVAEAWVFPAERNARYLRADELHTGFNFPFLKTPWDAKRMRDVIDMSMEANAIENAPTTWVLENHDVWRAATRYAPIIGTEEEIESNARQMNLGKDGNWKANRDLEVGGQRARANLLTMLALPGTAYIYQGQELGLNEVFEIPSDMRQDPSFFTSGGSVVGRDGCRVPIPWDHSSETYGFNTGTPTWLPQPDSWKKKTVADQDGEETSTLSLTRHALAIRKSQGALGGLTDGTQGLIWDKVDGDLVSFVRPARLGGKAIRSVMNMGKHSIKLDFEGEVLLVSKPNGFDDGLLDPDTTVWLTA